MPELLAAATRGQPSVGRRGRPASTRVGDNLRQEKGDDPVRRRELLSAAAAVFATPVTGVGTAHAATSTISPLEDLLLYGTAGLPPQQDPTPDAVADVLRASRQDFRSARYDTLARSLPGRIALAQTLQPAERSATAVADLYNIAVRLCIKLGEDGLVAITADRALAFARKGGNVLTIAESHRMTSSAWRRQGHYSRATDIALRAARELHADRSRPEAVRLSAEGSLLATAAYTAAKSGDRQTALTLISEAGQVAGAGALRHTARGDAGAVQVLLHRLSVHHLLGDVGQAIDLAKTVDPAALPTAERQARFFIDVARCFDQWGRPEQCYRALLAAERAAPQEVRRGVVKTLTRGLLRHDRRLPEVRAFAGRTGLVLD